MYTAILGKIPTEFTLVWKTIISMYIFFVNNLITIDNRLTDELTTTTQLILHNTYESPIKTISVDCDR